MAVRANSTTSMARFDPLDDIYELPAGYPSCLQATLASIAPHRSSQIVPQMLLTQISKRPCSDVPSRILRSPLLHTSIFLNSINFQFQLLF